MNNNYEKIHDARKFDFRFSDVSDATMVLQHNVAKNYPNVGNSEPTPAPIIEFSHPDSIKLGKDIVAEARRDVSIAFESAVPTISIAETDDNQDDTDNLEA